MMETQLGTPSQRPVLLLIDYEAGNLRSITKALEAAGARVALVRTPEDAPSHDGIVLPGVGAFGAAMARLNQVNFPRYLKDRARAGVPLLGVCLGVQLLFEESEEGGDIEGLGLLPGDVRRLPPGLKVPHMGWNQLTITKPAPLLVGVPDDAFVYFVHSYIVHPRAQDDVIATTTYGEAWPAVVQRDRVIGLQFHPEKSGAIGQQILRNFIASVVAPTLEDRDGPSTKWKSSPRST